MTLADENRLCPMSIRALWQKLQNEEMQRLCCRQQRAARCRCCGRALHVGVALHSVGIAASSAALCQTTTHDKTYDTQSFVGYGNYDDPRLKMSHEGEALV